MSLYREYQVQLVNEDTKELVEHLYVYIMLC
jgi:hypothetical protein